LVIPELTWRIFNGASSRWDYTSPMRSQRWRPLLFCAGGILIIWLGAFAITSFAKSRRMTAEKFTGFANSIELSSLSGDARARSIQELADKLNRLSMEERRRVRLEGTTFRVFAKMTEEEKATFVEKTLPTGFKQMLSSFEKMPEDRRKRAVDEALANLRKEQARPDQDDDTPPVIGEETNASPVLSPELEAKVRSIGLQTFYSQSSAATKAELAPVLEELQRLMESGRTIGPRPRR
jgi:hypothetical protein